MQLLLAPFANFPASFIAFGISIAMAALMVFIFVRAASTAEGRPSLLRRWMKMPNTKILFGLLSVIWAVGFGLGMLVVPHVGASSPTARWRSSGCSPASSSRWASCGRSSATDDGSLITGSLSRGRTTTNGPDSCAPNVRWTRTGVCRIIGQHPDCMTLCVSARRSEPVDAQEIKAAVATGSPEGGRGRSVRQSARSGAGARPRRPAGGQPPRAAVGRRARREVERLALAAQPPGQRPRRDRAGPRADRRGARRPQRRRTSSGSTSRRTSSA